MKKFKCSRSNCNFSGLNLMELVNHLKIVHKCASKFSCKICEFLTEDIQELKNHRKNCLSERTNPENNTESTSNFENSENSTSEHFEKNQETENENLKKSLLETNIAMTHALNKIKSNQSNFKSLLIYDNMDIAEFFEYHIK